MKATAIMTAILLAACGFVMAACSGSKEPTQPLEFICEDDGGVVERHVGVKDAWSPYLTETPVWRIQYTDGHIAFYHQPQGETCFTETAAFKAD